MALKHDRVANIKTVLIDGGKMFCSICCSRKRFSVMMLVLDVKTPVFMQLEGKSYSAVENRIGIQLCKACAKRLSGRVDTLLDALDAP